MLWNKGPPDLSRLQRIAFFRGNVYMLYVAEIPKDRGFIPFFWAFEIPIFSGISVLIYKGIVRLVGKPFGKKTVEKPTPERLMGNVHMQGFRNPEE